MNRSGVARSGARAGAGLLATACLLMSTSVGLDGQGRGNAAAGPPPSSRAIAPLDLSGYWVSIVNEDWRFRMLTPPKGDYESVPLTQEGRRVADTWDPARDEAANDRCKAYGPPGAMRAPGRLHITWQDDRTLRIDTDAGTQTRLFRFGAPGARTDAPSLQGVTAAEWVLSGARNPGLGAGGAAGVVSDTAGKFGTLKAVTTRMRPGYLRKNGVPFSGNAVLTEYFDTIDVNGQAWLVVTQMIDDPQYLRGTFVVSSNFKKESDGSKWAPTPCSAR